MLWYLGNGQFSIHGHFFYCNRMNFIVGGTGITPALAVMKAVVLAERAKNVSIRLVFSNKTVADIICKEELDDLLAAGGSSFQICHVITHEKLPAELDDVTGVHYEFGLVDTAILKRHLLDSAESSCFLCGPPAMIHKAVLPALVELGFDDDQIFEF